MKKTGLKNGENELFPFSFSLDKIRYEDDSLYSELLKILLLDRSRKRNIIWATDAYKGRDWESPVCQSSVSAIRPRAFKEDAEKQSRVKTHAEVFTPFEVVSQMTETLWEEPEGRDKTYLEIACGEAPFITSRYDTATGNPIPLEKRVGILDRKLQQTEKAAKGDEDWIEKAEAALKSVYGYEFQGDSLFIARVNVLDAFLENFEARFHRLCDRDLLLKEANIVSWNFWQMDGRTQSSPVKGKGSVTNDLFNDNPTCRIRFWDQPKSTLFSHIRLEERRDMKRFYACIGNPPYQSAEKESGASFHASIYPQFMEQAYHVADKVELITPARFLSGAGRVNRKWSEKILNDPHFSVLYREQDSKKVFPNIDLRGGVCISLWDREKVSNLQKSLTPFPELNSVEEKVSPSSARSLMDFVRPDYHYSEKMGEEIPWVFSYISSSGQERRITTNSFKSQRKKLNGVVFFDSKPEGTGEWAQILGLDDKNRRVYKYINRDYIRGADQGDLAKWKVFVPKSNGSGALGETLSTPLIGQPLIGHTRTFLSIGSFDTEREAEACLKYVKSKFARAMLGILKVTQDNPKDTWEYVPWQDFTPSSDIDWSRSIPDIDRQLYKKYGLSSEEIAFIESNVKEME
mgnify:CR=1 FL=1